MSAAATTTEYRMRQAAILLAHGFALQSVADRLNVSRSTLRTWRDHSEAFQSLLTAEKQRAADEIRIALQPVITEAMAVLRDQLRTGSKRERRRLANKWITLLAQGEFGHSTAARDRPRLAQT